MNINHTLKLDSCWCCVSKVSLDEHHVVPREYGGSKGPTVTLCGNCHKLVHRVASNVWSQRTKTDKKTVVASRLKDYTGDKQKITYLVDVILRARAATATTPQQKAVNVVVKLNPDQRRRFQELKKVLGKTNHDLVIHALNDLYQRTFD